MRQLTALSSLLVLALVAAAENRRGVIDAVDLDVHSPRAAALSNAIRAIELADGSVVAIVRSEQYEPFAMIATLLTPDGRTEIFRATDWIPEGFAAKGTAGQIYSATLTDDGRTMAISIGWTNAVDRNINGVVLLDRKGERWQRRNVVVLRGSVRDLVAAPDGGILAVVADPSRNVPIAALLLLGNDGRIRAELRPYQVKATEADEVALDTRLQRVGERDIAVYRLHEGRAHVLRLAKASDCMGDIREDNGFSYPRYGDQCYAAALTRLSSFADLPKEAQSVRDLQVLGVRMNGSGSLTVVRQGYDGDQTHVFVTKYGHENGMATWTRRGLWRSVRIGDETVSAVEIQRDGLIDITAKAP